MVPRMSLGMLPWKTGFRFQTSMPLSFTRWVSTTSDSPTVTKAAIFVSRMSVETSCARYLLDCAHPVAARRARGLTGVFERYRCFSRLPGGAVGEGGCPASDGTCLFSGAAGFEDVASSSGEILGSPETQPREARNLSVSSSVR